MKAVIVRHSMRDQTHWTESAVERMEFFLDAVTKGRAVDALVKVTQKALAVAAYGSASNAPRDEILDAFQIEAQAGVALFDLGAHPGEDRTYALGDRSVTVRTESAHGETLPIEWLYAYSAACAARDAGCAQQLAAVSPDVVRRSMRVMNYDEYNCVLVEGIGALHRNDPSARELLLHASDLAGPEHATVAPEWAKCMGQPLAELGLRIAEGEPNAFNFALAAAVEQHKAYWSKNVKTAGLSRRDDPLGILALWPLGLACLAHDRGMPIDVESDYIPSWIIRHGA